MRQSSEEPRMWCRNHKGGIQRGFAIGELLMVASLVTFAATGVMTLMKHARKGTQDNGKLAYQQLIQQGRETIDRLVQEVGQAGTPSLPNLDENSNVSAANSNRVAASQFLVATPTQLVFEADLDQDGDVERVEYRLNGETLERSEVTKYPNGGAPTPIYIALIGNVDNGALPLFSYSGNPFYPAGVNDAAEEVRVLLLLRTSEDPKKQPYRTVGFEGIARRQNTVATRQGQTKEQSSNLRDDSAADHYFSQESLIQETYARKWTLR